MLYPCRYSSRNLLPSHQARASIPPTRVRTDLAPAGGQVLRKNSTQITVLRYRNGRAIRTSRGHSKPAFMDAFTQKPSAILFIHVMPPSSSQSIIRKTHGPVIRPQKSNRTTRSRMTRLDVGLPPSVPERLYVANTKPCSPCVKSRHQHTDPDLQSGMDRLGRVNERARKGFIPDSCSAGRLALLPCQAGVTTFA